MRQGGEKIIFQPIRALGLGARLAFAVEQHLALVGGARGGRVQARIVERDGGLRRDGRDDAFAARAEHARLRMTEQQAPQQQARARADGQAQATAQRRRVIGAGVGCCQQVVLAHGRSLAQFRGDGVGLAQADAVDGARRRQGAGVVVHIARIVIIQGAEARAADARGRIDGFLQQGRQVERAGQGRARVVE